MAFPITVFSDFACPYSYVTEAALRSLGLDELAIQYRAFELFPDPVELPPLAIGDEERATLERLATFQGIDLSGGAARPRTRKAHEAARFARERDVEAAFRDLLYAALWRDGRDIGRIDVLVELAAAAGIEPEEMKIALDIDRHEADVLHDADVVGRLRLPGTPTIFLGTGPQARILAGAHGPAVLRTMIEDALREEDSAKDV